MERTHQRTKKGRTCCLLSIRARPREKCRREMPEMATSGQNQPESESQTSSKPRHPCPERRRRRARAKGRRVVYWSWTRSHVQKSALPPFSTALQLLMRPQERSPCARAVGARHLCNRSRERGGAGLVCELQRGRDAAGGGGRHLPCTCEEAVGCSPHKNVFVNLFSIVIPCRSRSSSRSNRRPASTVPKPASAGRIPAPGPVPGHPGPPPHWSRRLDHAQSFDRRARAPQRVAARARPPCPWSDARAHRLRGPETRFSAVQKRGRGGASCARAVPAPDTTFLAGGVICRALVRARYRVGLRPRPPGNRHCCDVRAGVVACDRVDRRQNHECPNFWAAHPLVRLMRRDERAILKQKNCEIDVNEGLDRDDAVVDFCVLWRCSCSQSCPRSLERSCTSLPLSVPSTALRWSPETIA